jgi:2-dehydro-3-deoxyphosphogluconate aldolase/(4S)-4-hydroxy-2-oxoglutarate aldolase
MSLSADTLARLRAARAIAILRCNDAPTAERALEAAIEGGFRAVEVTLSVPGAIGLAERFARRGALTVGVGTVLTVDEVARAADAGARLVVSPIVDEAVIEAALARDLVVVPGAATPTEMVRAARAGAQLQKLFPAPADGPAWIRQVLGPLPSLRIVPTAGVRPENAAAHLAAGAFAVGLVSSLFDPADLAAGRFEEIRARAARALESVGAAPPAG